MLGSLTEEPLRMEPSGLRQDQLEMRSLVARCIDEVAAVSACEGARDRETEAMAAGVVAACEPLEEPRPQLLRDTGPLIGDRDP